MNIGSNANFNIFVLASSMNTDVNAVRGYRKTNGSEVGAECLGTVFDRSSSGTAVNLDDCSVFFPFVNAIFLSARD